MIDPIKLQAKRERDAKNKREKRAIKLSDETKRVNRIAQHNRDLHSTSAYLADQARAVERALDRKRWSHSA
jgi:hypothetical protein